MSDSGQIGTSKANGRGRRRLLWLVAVLLAVLAIVIFMPRQDLQKYARESNSYNSASNLKQIGLAIYLYARDHGGDYPDNFGTLLLNEDITTSIFNSPGSTATPATGPTTHALLTNLTAGGHLSYVYLGRGLSGKVADNVVVAYEDPTIFPTGANILFADGHVEFDDERMMRQITDKAAAGIFPVTVSATAAP